MAYVPAFVWSGFYVGVNAGAVFTDNDIITSGNAANTAANVAANRRPARIGGEETGFIGGGQIGYNFQFGQIVAGLEADIAYTDLRKRSNFLSTLGDPSTYRQKQEYLGTVRARLGYAFDRLLIYGTGGFAYGKVNYEADFFRNTDGALQFTGRGGDVETGWTIGGGLEYALLNNLTIKGEYLYYDLGRKNVTVNAVPTVGLNSYNSRFETKGHVVRVGLNYKFNLF